MSPLTGILIVRLVSQFMKKNKYYVLCYTFVCFVFFKLVRLFKYHCRWVTLPDETLIQIVNEYSKHFSNYLDYNSCVLIGKNDFNISTLTWCYICSKISRTKYKVLVIPLNTNDSNTVFISEIMRNNIEFRFSFHELSHLFILPTKEDNVIFAQEARISFIQNPYGHKKDLIDVLLKNYFSVPRFLKMNDTICVNIKEYAEDHFYSSIPIEDVHFKITGMKVKIGNVISDGCYIVQGKTTLIEEQSICSYIPCKSDFIVPYQLSFPLKPKVSLKKSLLERYPECMARPLDQLKGCIAPFIRKDNRIHIKPIFLVRGPEGSGKRKLVQFVADILGINLFDINCAELQALVPAQTEAKLRIIFYNAARSLPSLICFNNLQMFSKNSEGQEDQRIISTFASEIKNLYRNSLKFPIVIIATLEGSNISEELQRIFVETVEMNQLNQHERYTVLRWIIAMKGLKFKTDLSEIAELCSDFRYADLVSLILQTTKIKYEATREEMELPLVLETDDFVEAYELIQAADVKSKNSLRIPKVYWDDIGGLAELKDEIARRIRLPLLNDFGFGQSGLLLYGPPGTGKTLLAKAVATEYQLHFLSIKGPEMLNMYVGQSEKNIRQVFERARASSPCVIFFDELDSLAPNRGRSGDSGGVMDRVVSQLLAEMDGLENAGNIFIIGATNRIDLVDPALLRPGRFDKLLYVGINSDKDSQLSVLKALTRKFNLPENGKELEEIVTKLPDNLTGADLYAVCSDAWLIAARRYLNKYNASVNDSSNTLDDNITVESADFMKAIRVLKPSVSHEDIQKYKQMQMNFSPKQYS